MKYLPTLLLVLAIFFVSFSSTYALSVFYPSQGGTGTSTPPTYGQMLVGNAAGTYTLTATSSLGITPAPAGASSTVQYNANGVLAGNTGLIYTGNRLGIGSSTPAASLGVTGNGMFSGTLYSDGSITVGRLSSISTGALGSFVSGNTVINSTSASIANTLYVNGTTGNVGVGTTTPWANLSIQDTPGSPESQPILVVSSSTPGINAFAVYPDGYIQAGPLVSKDTVFCTFGKQCFGYFGSDNTLSGVNMEVGNYSNGASAYGAFTLLNDLDDSTGIHFAVVNLNSSRYSDTTFGTAFAIPNQLQIYNTDGPTTISADTLGTSTPTNGYINFGIGGSNLTNEIARITTTGLGIGTTSPFANLSIAAASLQSTPLFAISTSTASATTTAILVSNKGNVSLLNGASLSISSLTSGNCVQAGTGGLITTVSSACGSGTVNTGTTGQFPYYAANGTTLTATSSLFLATSGNVGIGTTTPGGLLSIGGAAGGTAPLVDISTSTAAFATSTAFIVDNNGKVGIGTSSPSQTLSVSGPMLLSGALTYGGVTLANSVTGTASMVLSNGPTFSGTVKAPTLIGGTGVAATLTLEGSSNVSPTTGGSILFQTSNGVQVATFASSTGALGIGTTSPYSLLSVAGQVVAQNYIATSTTASSTFGAQIAAQFNVTATPHIYFGNGTDANDWMLTAAGGRGNIWYNTSDAGGNEAMTFAAGSGKGVDLDVNCTNNTFNSGCTQAVTVLSTGNTGIATSSPWLTFSTNGRVAMANLTQSSGLQTAVACFNGNNELIFDTVACLASALRYKMDINLFPDNTALDQILALNPVTYLYKPDFNGGLQKNPNYSRLQLGLIADDVVKVNPAFGVVTTATTTFEGKTYPAGTIQAIDYNEIDAALVGAVKAQQQEILSLKTLKGMSRSLEENWQDSLIGLLLIWCCLLTYFVIKKK